MVSSIALLLILQAFWLTNSYERAYFDLRRETNNAFRTTVFALRDSALMRQVVITGDSSNMNGKVIVFERFTTSTSTIDTLRPARSPAKVILHINSNNPDSIRSIIAPLASRVRQGREKFNQGDRFTLRLRSDSLSMDSLDHHFQKALAEMNIDAPFQIRARSFQPPKVGMLPAQSFFGRAELERGRTEFARERIAINVFSDSLSSEWVPTDPFHRYAAVFTNFRPIIFKAILPQILFSLFLTLVTATAFIILHKSLRSQQRLIVMKNDFISNITHELKTPIATVSVALEALKNFNGIDNPVRTREYLDIAQHELGRLSVLTDKVLNTSLFDERGVKLDLEKVDLEKIIEEILNSMTLLAEKNQSSIEFKKTGSDFIMDGSNVHLTNVIYNLLDNAIKYTPVKPEINVQLTDNGDYISLSVTDNGLGIPKEFHDKIFEKFFRMPTGDVHTIKGYGLGLSYVESVVKAHHGKISLVSESGKGSTFKIVLPRVNANA